MPSPFAMGRRLVLTLLCLLAGGCATPHSEQIAIPVHPVRAVLAPPLPSGNLNPIARVQGLPLYRDAETACRHHDYTGAARLLQRLANTPPLSTEERHFVLQQRNLCLKDAGLPAPALPALASSSPASRIAVSRPLTPEEADCGPRALLLVCRQFGVLSTPPV